MEISTLSEEMEKLANRIEEDLMNTLVNLDGNQKDIATGTRIKIPTDAGFVNYYKSANSTEISIWMKEEVQPYETPEIPSD